MYELPRDSDAHSVTVLEHKQSSFLLEHQAPPRGVGNRLPRETRAELHLFLVDAYYSTVAKFIFCTFLLISLDTGKLLTDSQILSA